MKFVLDFQTEIDVLTQGELDQSLGRSNDQLVSAFLRGIKHIRLPRLRGTVGDDAITLGVTSAGPQSGPDSGFAWAITRLTVAGLAGGATPDVLGFYRSDVSGDFLWSLDGNTPFETFGRGALTMYGGDTLVAANIGTLAATGTITVSGEAWEVPAEMLGKLA